MGDYMGEYYKAYKGDCSSHDPLYTLQPEFL